LQNHLNVEVRSNGRARVISVAGELDLASSPAFEEELARITASDAKQIVLDLRELEFMDSTGLSMLVKAQQLAEEAGQRFGLVKGSPQVQRLLALTGIEDLLVLADTPEELLSERLR
jgi:anti-sigma B factor antagonist